ncbi:alpha/beta fold hydrolase [Glycomyces dulcitolivorans]|uniref:alpha/beta fold hydrolase n=1 Tax=Glycomyces dulcitolivorans TaxID=2200759 RepID=UPI00130024CB|nr:alpha/beta fold hydrolase [Glycomyces dulcitolivorans]
MPATTPFTHPSRYPTYWREVQERVRADIHPGTGTHTILFAHGLGGSTEFWESVDSSRDLRGATLVRLNFLDHGPSEDERDLDRLWAKGDPARYPNPMEAFADQLEEVFREVQGNGTVHIVSHSMGTVPALILLSRLRRDGIPFNGRFISIEGNLTEADCGLASRKIAAMAPSFADYEGGDDHPLYTFHERLGTSRHRAERLWGMNMRFCWPPFLVRAAEDLVQWCDSGRAAALWEEVDNPVYFYGELTGFPEHNRRLLAAATVVEVPGSGHFPMIDSPHSLWPEVARTINSTRRPRSPA